MMPSLPQLLIVGVLVLILFMIPKKIPGMIKDIGKSARALKKELKLTSQVKYDIEDELDAEKQAMELELQQASETVTNASVASDKLGQTA